MKKILFTVLVTLNLFFLSAQIEIICDATANGTTISTSSALFIDSGGQTGSGYSDNEDVTVTICSDTPGKSPYLTFNTFNLNQFDDDPGAGINIDNMTFYDGTDINAPLIGTYTGTQLLGLTIGPTNSNLTGCITIRFVSNSAETGQFIAAVSCKTPCQTVLADGIIENGITPEKIRVCVGQDVTFKNNGSHGSGGFTIESYKWDFMDGTFELTENATHKFNISGEYRVQLYVKDNNPDQTCMNTNLISLQVVVAPKPDFQKFPNDTTLCLGESLNFSVIPPDFQSIWNGFTTQQKITDGCLTDMSIGQAQYVNLPFSQFIPNSTITNVNQIEKIGIEIEHSFVFDLDLKIICPNGQFAYLFQASTAALDPEGWYLGIPNIDAPIDCADSTTFGTPYLYEFTDNASESWIDFLTNNAGNGGVPIPAGQYRPETNFSSLVGCPTNGVWKLSTVDNWANDDGDVFSLTVTLDDALLQPITPITPIIGLDADSSYWDPTAQFIVIRSTNGDDIEIKPTQAGTFPYTYFVIDNFSCTNNATVNVTVLPNPTNFAGQDTVICYNQDFIFNGQIQGGQNPATTYVYDWSPGNLVSDSTLLNPSLLAPMNQQFVLTIHPVNSPLCIAHDTIQITTFRPDNQLGNDQTICLGTGALLLNSEATALGTYTWSTGENTPTITANLAGTYWLDYGINNCFQRDSIEISFLPSAALENIPNVITANGDGINDVLNFESTNLEKFEIQLFNRWGAQIFQTNDPNNYWNGTSKGEPVSDGVYFYKIKYSNHCIQNGTEQNLQGNITVIGH